ncbi:riboflavin synthase [Mechercharimyces sp. CAU 1602]|uniref:riboflavin synthase n=1 Tax=Mechercharimyces sp. CAU 1602 TaxID=2973933 RepID=UPI0021631919|nr:riboflavin synthase [Mechercharimyces sp. CAU 1602]MCS1350858.1 riboflavin synthase [Mechercharimyces sp. CAU 1602]
MFTGLIEEVGTVQHLVQQGQTMKLTIACKEVLDGVALGDSIAINGVCLTVVHFDHRSFTADVMPETMKHTQLHSLQRGSFVNLERAMAAGGRFGGHFVQGHVDGVGTILERKPVENAVLFRLQVPRELTSYMIERGSIALNGISLTLFEVREDQIVVSIIPHTLAQTQLQTARVGDPINVECDMMGKYVRKQLQMLVSESSGEGLTKEKLINLGFA